MTIPISSPNVDDRIISKLRKILALTESPEENEAASAAAMLQRFLVEHNLSISDLEQKGAKAAAITEGAIDLGKAAFNWKLDLAEEIAEHYFCVGIISRRRKTVTFAGRPDNVESLKMLYTWVIDQIKRLAKDERRAHQAESGEHIDPLRWQVNFGRGAVNRLMDRLSKAKRDLDASTTALVIHHAKEVSDYTEKKYGRRYDGEMTEYEKINNTRIEKEWAERNARKQKEKEDAERLLATDPEAFYLKYPHRHPDVEAERQRREARNAARRARYVSHPRWSSADYDYDKDEQSNTAHRAGGKAASRINLDPFLTGTVPSGKDLKGKGRG